MVKKEMKQEDIKIKYFGYLKELFNKAFQRRPFDFVCTLLRVDGMAIGHWDPMEEINEALEDFNQILKKAIDDQNVKRTLRIGLLMYCHATEMSAPYHILMNILRCVQGEAYKIRPFSYLVRTKKKSILKYIPPSASSKIKEIKKLASKIGEDKLCEIIDEFFYEEIRNAFYHSDYCITQTDFRITEGGPARVIPIEKVTQYISNCFIFYEAFFQVYYLFKHNFKHIKRFHKWPNYEVLELLVNEKEGLYGFKVHFSNGTHAIFERHKENVNATNIIFEEEGINFFIGNIDALKKEWLVNGQKFEDIHL